MIFVFYMLVISFGSYDYQCKQNPFCKVKAEPPFVAFYWNKNKVANDAEAMPSRLDSVKVFKFTCMYEGCDITEMTLKNSLSLVDSSTHTIDGSKL